MEQLESTQGRTPWVVGAFGQCRHPGKRECGIGRTFQADHYFCRLPPMVFLTHKDLKFQKCCVKLSLQEVKFVRGRKTQDQIWAPLQKAFMTQKQSVGDT